MNDIIILGNGFDLAHGLATGYKDYVRAMLIDSLLVKGEARSTYKDSPFKLSGSIEDSGLRQYHFQKLENQSDENLTELFTKRLDYNNDDGSGFIREVIEDFERKGWVNLENSYFSIVEQCITQEGINETRADSLNIQMEELKISLCQYLGTLERPAPSEDIRTLFEQIKKGQIERASEQARQNRIDLKGSHLEDHAEDVADGLEGITVLTFNYTDTCEALYKDALTIKVGDIEEILEDWKKKNSPAWKISSPALKIKEDIPPTFIHIHGSLKEDDIVLGYGDETTDRFRELEEANDNDLTKYFKSFYYMQNSRYRQFFEILERGPFRLHLMGHSCGLSDRVLLSSIFNHPNLEDVRIYYHDRGKDRNDYLQLCQNISRHFHDKHAMRLKILPCKGKDPNMMSVPLIPHKKS